MEDYDVKVGGFGIFGDFRGLFARLLLTSAVGNYILASRSSLFPIIEFQEFVVSRDLPNILASRYASSAMVDIWTPSGKVVLEREFWLAVLEAQNDLGVTVDQSGKRQ